VSARAEDRPRTPEYPAERDERCLVGHHELELLEADEQQKEPDARPDGAFDRFGKEPDDVLTGADDGQQDEEDPLDEDRGERRLPRNAEAEHDAEREEGVEPHPGCEPEGTVGVQRHHERRGCRGEDRRDGDHLDDLDELVPRYLDRLGENERVYHDDVRHREERRDPGDDLGPEVGAVLFYVEPRCHGICEPHWVIVYT